MGMDTTYCDNCGLLHDPDDGDCLGCKISKQLAERDKTIAELKAIRMRQAVRLDKQKQALDEARGIMFGLWNNTKNSHLAKNQVLNIALSDWLEKYGDKDA